MFLWCTIDKNVVLAIMCISKLFHMFYKYILEFFAHCKSKLTVITKVTMHISLCLFHVIYLMQFTHNTHMFIPYTGCTLSNGGWVEVGSTYMDDCNTWYDTSLCIIVLSLYCDVVLVLVMR